jgi:hypothetical protein
MTVSTSESAYRQAERRYRVRRVALNAKQTRFARAEPCLEDGVIDFDAPTINTDPRVRRLLGPEEAGVRRRLRALGGWGLDAEDDDEDDDDEEEEKGNALPRVYALRDRPGTYYIANALGPRAQARWARVCLARFSRWVMDDRGHGGRMGVGVWVLMGGSIDLPLALLSTFPPRQVTPHEPHQPRTAVPTTQRHPCSIPLPALFLLPFLLFVLLLVTLGRRRTPPSTAKAATAAAAVRRPGGGGGPKPNKGGRRNTRLLAAPALGQCGAQLRVGPPALRRGRDAATSASSTATR